MNGPNGKGAAAIDADHLAKQRITARCTCGAKARGQLTIPEAQAWQEAHRLAKHPDRPDAATYLKYRRKAVKAGGLKMRTHWERREHLSDKQLAERDENKYKPGLA